MNWTDPINLDKLLNIIRPSVEDASPNCKQKLYLSWKVLKVALFLLHTPIQTLRPEKEHFSAFKRVFFLWECVFKCVLRAKFRETPKPLAGLVTPSGRNHDSQNSHIHTHEHIRTLSSSTDFTRHDLDQTCQQDRLQTDTGDSGNQETGSGPCPSWVWMLCS